MAEPNQVCETDGMRGMMLPPMLPPPATPPPKRLAPLTAARRWGILDPRRRLGAALGATSQTGACSANQARTTGSGPRGSIPQAAHLELTGSVSAHSRHRSRQSAGWRVIPRLVEPHGQMEAPGLLGRQVGRSPGV